MTASSPCWIPAHQEALLSSKRKALHSTPAGRLAQAAPESKTLLDRAFAQGESAGSQTAQLLRLLDLYGVAALRRAIARSAAAQYATRLFGRLPAAPQPRSATAGRWISAAILKPNRWMSARMIWRLTMNSPNRNNNDDPEQ